MRLGYILAHRPDGLGHPGCSSGADFMTGTQMKQGIDGDRRSKMGCFHISSSLTGRYVSPESAVRREIKLE